MYYETVRDTVICTAITILPPFFRPTGLPAQGICYIGIFIIIYAALALSREWDESLLIKSQVFFEKSL
ncbi:MULTISPECIES: hypothetical protein [Blautia]|uniref:Uncharacterized protein n=1 Tax=Blautia hominis TaxID=2025493 RepID=A0ABQ0BGJ0_9FIRM